MREIINSFAFVVPETGANIEYDGPFSATPDGSTVEIEIPVIPDDWEAGGDTYTGVGPDTADHLAAREGDLGVALADGSIFSSGIIEAADVIEQTLLIRVNDGNIADPVTIADADIDLDEGGR